MSKLSDMIHKQSRLVTDRHMIVEAYAGTGKTFTQIVGVGYAFSSDFETIEREIAIRGGHDPDTFRIIPSPEQEAIWNEMVDNYRSGVESVTYCAFNKSIVNEFSTAWGWMAERLVDEGVFLNFATVNSLGNSVVRDHFGRLDVKSYVTRDIACDILGVDPFQVRDDKVLSRLTQAVSSIVSLCKLELVGWSPDDGFDPDHVTESDIHRIASHYDIEMNGSATRIVDLVPQVLDRCLRPEENRNRIHFDDQNWLPIVLDLPLSKVDLVMVDEGQDLPRCRQEFVLKMGKNVMLVGDSHQAIYGFAGADVDSIPRMKKILGVESLNLTETRRCGKAVVKEAQALVPGFSAHKDNPKGKIVRSTLTQYMESTKDGDMILCRVNAPLISQALQFLKSGRKAIIRGRDFGGQLKSFIDQMNAESVSDLLDKVDFWYDLEAGNEARRKNPNEAKLIALEDKRSAIHAFSESTESVESVKEKIDLIFSGKQCPECGGSYNEEIERCFNKRCCHHDDPNYPNGKYKVGPNLVTPKGILFSTIHKSKGLEADNVFLLEPKGATCPHPLAKTKWQQGQEYNLRYVAITRAINTLTYVSDDE